MAPRKKRIAVRIIRRLREAGHEAYLAGGCVRDELLGLPADDYDVATSATPEQVAELFSRVVPVGVSFGVQLVVVDSLPVEVATFRGEEGYSDGRRPDKVFFTGARQDVMRRDFTINGMMMDPLSGEIFDWVGGRDDLKARVIRTIGEPETRFGEDRLRLLRAVRLAARLGFAIEEKTADAIRRMSAQVLFVSPERVCEEMTKTLTGPRRGDALLTLHGLGLLESYLPEVDYLARVQQTPDHHPEGDVLTHTALVLNYLADFPSPLLAWSSLLHDVGKGPTAVKDAQGGWHFPAHETVSAQMALRIGRRLRMSSKLLDGMYDIVLHHMEFMGITERRDAKLKRFLMKENIELLLELHRADSLASDRDLSAYEFCETHLRLLRESPPPEQRKLITGDDLIGMGYAPGPYFKEILKAVEDAIMDEEVLTRHHAMDFVRRHFPRLAPDSGAEAQKGRQDA